MPASLSRAGSAPREGYSQFGYCISKQADARLRNPRTTSSG
jgi:hypothetical protein